MLKNHEPDEQEEIKNKGDWKIVQRIKHLPTTQEENGKLFTAPIP